MKIRNHLVVALLAAGTVLGPGMLASAEDAAPPPRRPGVQQRVDRMSEELKLTDDQKTKVKALFEDEQKKLQEARKDMKDASQDQRTEKRRELRDNLNKNMKSILTSDQYEKWQKMGEDARRNGRKKGAGSADKSSDSAK